VIADEKLDPPVAAALAQSGWKRRQFGDLYVYAVTNNPVSSPHG
jgi:hypothetical protein